MIVPIFNNIVNISKPFPMINILIGHSMENINGIINIILPTIIGFLKFVIMPNNHEKPKNPIVAKNIVVKFNSSIGILLSITDSSGFL